MKEHSLPESRRARATCLVPTLSTMKITAVASKTALWEGTFEAQLTVSGIAAEAEVIVRSLDGEKIMSLDDCGQADCDSDDAEDFEHSWV